MLDHQVENDLVEVWAPIPRIPFLNADNLAGGLLLRLILAVERKTGRVQVGKPRGQVQLIGRMSR